MLQRVIVAMIQGETRFAHEKFITTKPTITRNNQRRTASQAMASISSGSKSQKSNTPLLLISWTTFTAFQLAACNEDCSTW
jgi:hypothetical protein